MSQKNVEIVRDLWDAYSRGDIDRVIALSDPYVVLVTLEEGPLYGPDAVRANYARWMEAWRTQPETTVEEVIDSGDHVIVIACFQGRGREAASESHSGCTRSTPCATGRSCALTSSATATKPSKPWAPESGHGSRSQQSPKKWKWPFAKSTRKTPFVTTKCFTSWNVSRNWNTPSAE